MAGRREYFSQSGFTDNEAKIIGPVLDALAERGPVTARDVVDSAKSKNSPLHDMFEWDDARAAQLHRLNLGQSMIQNVRVRIIEPVGKQAALQVVRVIGRPSGVPVAFNRSSMAVKAADHERVSEERRIQKALNPAYYPNDLDEAYEIIDELRARVIGLTKPVEEYGRDLKLTSKERKVYNVLRNSGVVTKENLLNALYGLDTHAPEIKIIDVFICKLRKKLPPDEMIKTIWGCGYQWVGKIDVSGG